MPSGRSTVGAGVGEVGRALETWEGLGILFQVRWELTGKFLRAYMLQSGFFLKITLVTVRSLDQREGEGNRPASGSLRKWVHGVMVVAWGRAVQRLTETDGQGAILEVGVTSPRWGVGSSPGIGNSHHCGVAVTLSPLYCVLTREGK